MGFEFCHPAVNFIFFTAVLYGSIAFSHPVFLAIACAAALLVMRGHACVWDYPWRTYITAIEALNTNGDT